MIRTITQFKFLQCWYSRSIKQVAFAAFAFLLANPCDAQERTPAVADTVKNANGDKPGSGKPQSKLIPILYGTQEARHITSAVSVLSGGTVSNIPGANRVNSLSGRLAGLSVLQQNGMPALEENIIQIRGSHSFTGDNRPLILINNRVDDPSQLDPNDIESITILKDAASTVMAGMTMTAIGTSNGNGTVGNGSAGNGIILITTKRGEMGKLKIDYNVGATFQQPTRSPKFLDAYNYALLYNEAQRNDNPLATPRYDATALDAFNTGSNPYLYPNVDWQDELLKKNSLQTRNSLNVRGGGDNVKYFFSGSYLHDNGLFNVNKSVNTYDTDAKLNVLNLRANIDVQVSKNLTFSTDIRSKREQRNQPGPYSINFDETVLGAIYGTPAAAYPMLNADGSIAGNVNYTNNPYAQLNYAGYSNYLTATVATASELAYDFGKLVKGLKLKANFGFTNYSEFQVARGKAYATYELNTAVTPNTYTKRGTDAFITTATGVTVTPLSGYLSRYRLYDHSAALDYQNTFGQHSVSGLLMYERQQFDNASSLNLTKNFQGPKARFSYRFRDRYMLDLAASYQGSEQYPKGDRYGFFPAVSAGWILSEESFLKGGALDFLKIRGSYGRTGNTSSSLYYEYLNNYIVGTGTTGGAVFGTTVAGTAGAYLSQVGNPLITWEKILKSNAGIDVAMFQNRLNLSFDYFNEKASDVLITNDISAIYGSPYLSPTGSFKNKGFEIQAGWNGKINKVEYSVSGQYSQAKNTVVDKGEATRNYPWRYETGRPLSTRMGYVFDRYFTEADFAPGSTFPNQSSLGTQRPGDLKYKDLNDDKVIDDNDITEIGSAKTPQAHFGANFGLKFKAFDLNVFFQGTRGGTTYNSGATYWDFTNGGKGNVLEHHLDRWTPNSGQSASYPRLTLTNLNNQATSSYWVKDNSYVRLKYTEIGYTLPASFSKKLGMSSLRVYGNGYNLFLWDKVDQKDPEAQDNNLGYPIMQSFSLGLNVKF